MSAALAVAAAPADAQEGRIVLEGGGAHALPPAGVAAEAATYAVGGLRIEWENGSGALFGAGYAGRAGGDTGSDFLSGMLGGELWTDPSSPVGLGMGALVQAFAVDEPLLYRLSAAEIAPLLRLGRAGGRLVLRSRIGTGSSRVELRRRDGSVRRAQHDLWSRGMDAELHVGDGALGLTAVAGVHRSRGGSFRRAGLRADAKPGVLALRGELELWDTPNGREVVGTLALSISLGRLEARVSRGRTAPDPLTLVDAGTQTSALVGLGVLSFGGDRSAVHEVVRSGRPSRVRVRVTPPPARSVELLGDFSDWVPVALERDGAAWTGEVEVEPGTYHFGFLVDGEWWIPEGLQGTVPDEWGQTNATMVVPG